ncbi:MAG: hypothetical protein SFU56_13070 [Capsulimonadales bacterium]|nr:hypothetical protein [Capsulimonadales bacterium]
MAMEAEEFRRRVRQAFGEDLHRASPASVREFLDHLPLTTVVKDDGKYYLDETAKSYEEVMRTFFNRVLDLPAEQAAQMLWAVAFDLAYAVIESHDAERIGHLFRGFDDPSMD